MNMGDRTYASVTIREEYYPLLVKWLEVEHNEPAPDVHWKYSKLIEDLTDDVEFGEGEANLICYEANYGEMEDITNALEELAIPYNHNWENGSDFLAGCVLMRFSEDGNSSYRTEYTEARYDTCELTPLLRKIKEEAMSSEQIIEYLEDRQKTYRAYNDQEELTKIPLRAFTEEESAIIMEYKLKKEGKDG